ncbi:MAG: efflux RND transporter permease subunit, partial [Rikenellaceae bacterium]|nr:efflux RND transporter permease subunit [Rikenellaceae bacterium]
DNSKVIYFFLAVMLLGGILAFGKLGKKEDAPFVIKQAMLIASYPGTTALEMEGLVTETIERELQTMPGIYRIKSDSYSGMAKISVELQPYTPSSEIPQMWDILRRKVLSLEQRLPEGVTISVNDDFGDVFGLYYGLVADNGFSDEELRVTAQDIKRRLSVLDGVQQVTVSGEQKSAVNVNISLAKLAGLNISPESIIQTISSQNRLVNPGDKLAGALQIQLYADGAYLSLADIQNQLITTSSGGQIRLGDIAAIEQGYIDPPTSIVRIDGKHALGIAVSSPADKDVVKTSENVERELTRIKAELPVGMDLVTLYSEGDIARQANNGFLLNLVESVAIVILVLMLVMGFKASVLIGSSLIFSISGTLLIMQ